MTVFARCASLALLSCLSIGCDVPVERECMTVPAQHEQRIQALHDDVVGLQSKREMDEWVKQTTELASERAHFAFACGRIVDEVERNAFFQIASQYRMLVEGLTNAHGRAGSFDEAETRAELLRIVSDVLRLASQNENDSFERPTQPVTNQGNDDVRANGK